MNAEQQPFNATVGVMSFSSPAPFTMRYGSPPPKSFGSPLAQYAPASPELRNHAVELPSTQPHPEVCDVMPKKSGLLTPPSAMSSGAAERSAAVAPHFPVMMAVASVEVVTLASDPAWPGHALAHAALSWLQLAPPAAGPKISLKHFALPTGRNHPAGHAPVTEGVGVVVGDVD